MFANQGIMVDAWARIESNCRMEHEVVGGEMQIEFGTRTGVLNLVMTDEVVEQLAARFADAQATFRAMDAEAELEGLKSI